MTMTADISRNEQRVTAVAEAYGWHVEKRDWVTGVTTYRKHGRGYVSVYFASNGRVVSIRTARKYFARPSAARAIEYLTA
ncbi:hypothetical protein ACIRPH_31185 [Nocardiopsis sp. NPDC101807]|uniref:hypothetical protein n=1 Tax=Nocardiopsis sp. NPDC101807 TaxID=3364339 RepID=UPI00381E9E12